MTALEYVSIAIAIAGLCLAARVTMYLPRLRKQAR